MLLSLCAFKPMAVSSAAAAGSTGPHKVARVAQQCSACGRAALTLGQRLPYCGPTAFLPFRASSPSPPVLLTGAQRAVVSSTFPAHSFTTVINTSTDSVLCINNNIPVWLVGLCGGWRVSHDLFSLLPASSVVWLSESQIIENRTMKVISKEGFITQ